MEVSSKKIGQETVVLTWTVHLTFCSGSACATQSATVGSTKGQIRVGLVIPDPSETPVNIEEKNYRS